MINNDVFRNYMFCRCGKRRYRNKHRICPPTVCSFNSALLKFIRPKDTFVYSVHHPLGVV